MGSFKIEPENELQTREWFAAHIAESEYDLIASQGAFPDYVLRDSDGRIYRVEVEYESANFIRHGHDPDWCDFVLCWIHNIELALPVLELSTGTWYEVGETNELQELRQQCSQQGRRLRSKHKARNSIQVIENRNLLLEIIGNRVNDECNEFLLCFADHLQAKSKLVNFLAPSQLKLLKASRALTIALRESGLNIEDSCPDDLFKLVGL